MWWWWTAAFWVIRWGMIMLWLMCHMGVWLFLCISPSQLLGHVQSPECNISLETSISTHQSWCGPCVDSSTFCLSCYIMLSPLLFYVHQLHLLFQGRVFLCVPSLHPAHLYFFSVQVPGCVWGSCQEWVFPRETIYLWICSGDQDIPAIIPYAVYRFYLHCK